MEEWKNSALSRGNDKLRCLHRYIAPQMLHEHMAGSSRGKAASRNQRNSCAFARLLGAALSQQQCTRSGEEGEVVT